MPLEQEYTRQPWAQGTVQQAAARCRYEMNQLTNFSNWSDCMAAKGWQER